MAPEVMLRQNHSYPVDFFAVGVIAYEFMIGKVIVKFIGSDPIREEIEMTSKNL